MHKIIELATIFAFIYKQDSNFLCDKYAFGWKSKENKSKTHHSVQLLGVGFWTAAPMVSECG